MNGPSFEPAFAIPRLRTYAAAMPAKRAHARSSSNTSDTYPAITTVAAASSVNQNSVVMSPGRASVSPERSIPRRPPRVRSSGVRTSVISVPRRWIVPGPLTLRFPNGKHAFPAASSSRRRQFWRALQARQNVEHDGEEHRGNNREQNHREATDAAAERSYLHIAPNSHCLRPQLASGSWTSSSSSQKSSSGQNSRAMRTMSLSTVSFDVVLMASPDAGTPKSPDRVFRRHPRIDCSRLSHGRAAELRFRHEIGG